MAFTPNEIKNKKFSNVKNGIDATEVAQYLDQLSTEIERLKEDKKQLELMVKDKEDHIAGFKQVEQSVGEALIHAQKTGEDVRKAAEKDAQAIVEKANAESNRIVNDAVEKARRLSFQTEDMKRQSKIFRSRFRMLVEAQLDLLKNDDWDYLLNYDLDAQQVTAENINHINESELTEAEKQLKKQAEAQAASDQENKDSEK